MFDTIRSADGDVKLIQIFDVDTSFDDGFTTYKAGHILMMWEYTVAKNGHVGVRVENIIRWQYDSRHNPSAALHSTVDDLESDVRRWNRLPAKIYA